MWWMALLACTNPDVGTRLPTPATPVDLGTYVPTPPPPTPPTPEIFGYQSMRMVGYNVESGDAQPATISSYIEAVQGEVLWGLSEVESNNWVLDFAEAADDGGQLFVSSRGSTTWDDKLALLSDDTALELIAYEELHDINIGGNVRSPLVGTFRVRGSETQFKFMVNHLYRSNANARHIQASLLNEWVAEQTLPVVTIGDFNFDWDVDNGEVDHDAGFDFLTDNDAWRWVRPETLIKTQCSPFYNGVLDFVFTANGAQDWLADGDILHRDLTYCDDDAFRPDHRPVDALFEVPLQR
jgi:hypothetical protein